MSETHHIPTFNMKVVARETGLKPDTLRAWERRYGIPDPQRTAGGHRLYSQYEIDMLKWLIERQDEGMSISNAIDLWQQVVERGEDPLQHYAEPEVSPVAEPAIPVFGDVITGLCEAWIQACADFDEYRSQQVLAQAFATFPLEAVCFEVLQKGLSKIGQAWYEGTMSVQQEHFASSLAIRQLEALLAATAPPTQDFRLLVACPPREQHTFSPLLISLLFRRRGWDVVYLGANVPLDRLESTVKSIRPKMVILSAQTMATAAHLVKMADLLQDLGVPMAYGGAVFNYLEGVRERISGHFLGTELYAVPEVVAGLVQSGKPAPVAEPPSPAYQRALAHFEACRAAVEAWLQKSMDVDLLPIPNITNANEDMGDNIVAALKLGDVNLLMANINWVQGLLMNYHDVMPNEAIYQYLVTYHAALKANLDERGLLIIDWFTQLIKSTDAMLAVRREASYG